MEFPQPDGIAPADTDLGLLQRGRGAGWLRAAAAGPAGVDRLLACVARDPRWDSQVEPRGDYYATLALHLRVPPETLPVAAAADDDWLRLEVLRAMACRGSAAAGSVLAEAGGADDEDEPAPRRRRAPVAADAPISALLAVAGTELRPPYRKEILRRLRTTTDEAEIAALRKASLDVSCPGWPLAMQVLGLRDDPTPLPVAEELLAANQPGGKRAWAFGYVRALSPSRSLPLARGWLGLPDGRGAVAEAVFSKHAEPSDAPALLAALSAATDYFAISDLAKALGRLPLAEPCPLLDRVYVESADSYARARAVDAMAATDPAFGEKWATECLWDCEESARVRGAECAPLTAEVVARLNELADDDCEDSDVREAAHRRLGQG